MSALPGAALHTTLAARAKLIPALQQRPMHTTWMQRLPAPGRFYRHYFMLYPLAVEGVDLHEYDLVVTSCFGYAKGVHTRPDATHVCYCYTPMRWVWRSRRLRGPRAVQRRPAPGHVGRCLPWLRRWDLRASRRPDCFVDHLRVVAERIERFYGRTATVIPPPIDLDRFQIGGEAGDYYLVVSRLVAYKRIDLAIEACNRLRRRLVVIGDGPDRARLEALAGPTVTFLGRQPDAVVSDAAAGCRALLFPGEEDFGIAPLEANAAGRPVVAWRGGGATRNRPRRRDRRVLRRADRRVAGRGHRAPRGQSLECRAAARARRPVRPAGVRPAHARLPAVGRAPSPRCAGGSRPMGPESASPRRRSDAAIVADDAAHVDGVQVRHGRPERDHRHRHRAGAWSRPAAASWRRWSCGRCSSPA